MPQHSTPNSTGNHLYFFDHIRNITMLCVVLYHAVIPYSNVTPQFSFHNSTSSLFADYVRWVFDVFMMPVFFFVAGYFAIPSLEKKGAGAFIKGKIQRLGVPWLLVMISFNALLVWGSNLGSYFSQKNIVGFGDSLIDLIQGFTGFRISDNSAPQMHLWFISLLLFFFIVFCLMYMAQKRWFQATIERSRSNESMNQSISVPLFAFGIITSLAYFVAIYFIPQINSVAHLSVLTFEPTKTPLYIGYFGLGAYAYSKHWFSGNRRIENMAMWIGIFSVSLSVFLLIGMPVLSQRVVPVDFSVLQMLVFAVARSFFCLSTLVLLLIVGSRFWNSASPLSKSLSKNSYYIYIIHVFIVFSLQAVLINWQDGPTLIKIAVVFAGALLISYVISNFVVMKFPRITAAGLLIFCIALIVFINPHRYERAFKQQQATLAQEASRLQQTDRTLRDEVILLYHKALEDPSAYNEKAFEMLSMTYYRNEEDYEILSYLARITVVIGDSKNLLVHMVHDVIGYTWMDTAVEHDPENINIRFNRGVDSFNKPDVFADRWKYAEIDFTYLAEYIQRTPDVSKSFKEQVFSYLIKIYEKDGNIEHIEKYKTLLISNSSSK